MNIVETGVLVKEDFESLSDWSSNASISAVEKPAFVTFNPSTIPFLPTPASSDAGGVREAHWMVTDKEYLFYGAGDGSGAGAGAPWRQQMAHRNLRIVPFTRDSVTSIDLSKTNNPADGEWAARDNLFVAKFGSAYYNYVMQAPTTFSGGVPGTPYSSDVWNITSGDPVSNDNWQFVRNQLALGTGGDFDADTASGSSVVFKDSLYHHFYSAKDVPGFPADWAIGYATSTTPDGVLTKLGEIFVDGQVENPKLFYSSALEKWIFLCNQIADDGSRTDKNVLYVSDDFYDWSGASKYTFQKTVPATSLLDAIFAIGIPSPLYGTEGEIVESAEGNVSFTYDAASSPYSDNHAGRHIRFGGLEQSKYAARINNLTTTEKEIQRAVTHTDFHASFVVEVNSKSASGTRGVWFGFRKANSTTGAMYRLFIAADGNCELHERAGGGAFSTIATSADLGVTIYETLSVSSSQGNLHRVQIIVSGSNIKVYLNGELQIDHTDTTLASGTYITFGGVGVDAYFRRFSMRENDTVTISGLTNGQTVNIYGAGGYSLYASTTVSGTSTSFSLPHYPMDGLSIDGTYYALQMYGGDEVDASAPPIPFPAGGGYTRLHAGVL